MSDIPKFESLEDAQKYLRDNWKDGISCPCCGKFVKLYDIKIPGSGVADLIRLYKNTNGKPGEYMHVDEFSNVKSRSFPKLAYWGLAISMPNDDPKKRTSGMWAITQEGARFIEGGTVYERAFVFNKKGRGLHGKQVSVKTALGNKFDYEELMS